MHSGVAITLNRHSHRERFAIDAWGTWLSLALSLFTLVSCGSKSNEPDPVVIKQIWYMPAWSPDGTEIVCQVERIGISNERSYFVAIVDAATGEVRRERSVQFPSPFAFSWTPDGDWLLFGANPGIFKMTSDLDSLVQLTSGQFHTSPSYSRAREVVFFTVGDAHLGGLFSVTLDGDSLRRWSTQETTVLGTSAFLDESDSLVGFSGMEIPYPLMVFSPDAIGSASSLGGASDDPIVHISSDRRYIAYNRQISGSRELVLIDRTKDSSWAVTSAGASEEMSFSPDGNQLVFPILRGKEVGLWILDVATGEQKRLTDGTQ
jgi:Tol biopolymer transport system component